MRSSSIAAKFLCFTAFISWNAYALESQITPTVENVCTPNVHEVAPRVYRGNAPMDVMTDLDTLAITDVLIFKNDTKGEVADEIAILDGFPEMGFGEVQSHPIEFLWKDIPDYTKACKDTVKALQTLISVAQNPDRRIFFHCTVGEDRTGMLAGLFRVAYSQWSPKEAFDNEMCARGYEAGNANKPAVVVKEIREDVTPLYVAMAHAIEERIANGKGLSSRMCNTLKIDKKYNRKLYTCRRGTQPIYEPEPSCAAKKADWEKTKKLWQKETGTVLNSDKSSRRR